MSRRRSEASWPSSASAWSTAPPKKWPTTFSRNSPRRDKSLTGATDHRSLKRFSCLESLDAARDRGSDLFLFQDANGPKSARFRDRTTAVRVTGGEKRAFGPKLGGRSCLPVQ